MTPAMEEIALRRKTESPVPILNLQSPRVTRSRVAKSKRKITFHVKKNAKRFTTTAHFADRFKYIDILT